MKPRKISILAMNVFKRLVKAPPNSNLSQALVEKCIQKCMDEIPQDVWSRAFVEEAIYGYVTDHTMSEMEDYFMGRKIKPTLTLL